MHIMSSFLDTYVMRIEKNVKILHMAICIAVK